MTVQEVIEKINRINAIIRYNLYKVVKEADSEALISLIEEYKEMLCDMKVGK